MTAKESFWTVLLSIATCSFIGCASSLFASAIDPNYYDSVFRLLQSEQSDPLGRGMRLGAFQGGIVGTVIALGILALGIFRESRSHATNSQNQPSYDRQQRWSWTAILFWISSTLILVTISSTISAIVGANNEHERMIDIFSMQKINKLKPILNTDTYPDLEIIRTSYAEVFLLGTVPDSQTHRELFQQVATVFGTDEAESMFSRVEIEASPE